MSDAAGLHRSHRATATELEAALPGGTPETADRSPRDSRARRPTLNASIARPNDAFVTTTGGLGGDTVDAAQRTTASLEPSYDALTRSPTPAETSTTRWRRDDTTQATLRPRVFRTVRGAPGFKSMGGLLFTSVDEPMGSSPLDGRNHRLTAIRRTPRNPARVRHSASKTEPQRPLHENRRARFTRTAKPASREPPPRSQRASPARNLPRTTVSSLRLTLHTPSRHSQSTLIVGTAALAVGIGRHDSHLPYIETIHRVPPLSTRRALQDDPLDIRRTAPARRAHPKSRTRQKPLQRTLPTSPRTRALRVEPVKARATIPQDIAPSRAAFRSI